MFDLGTIAKWIIGQNKKIPQFINSLLSWPVMEEDHNVYCMYSYLNHFNNMQLNFVEDTKNQITSIFIKIQFRQKFSFIGLFTELVAS